MESSLLVNFKSRGDLELSSKENSKDKYLYDSDVIDPNLEFYEYFSSNETQPESSFFHQECDNNYDIINEASIHMTRLDSFNDTKYMSANEHINYNVSPRFVQEKHSNGLSFYNVSRENVRLIESSDPRGDEENVYCELNISDIEPTVCLERISRRYVRTAFEKWKSKFRLKQMTKEPTDLILSREYYRCKAEYQLQQKNCIAAVHFKISILSDSFHKWRLYSIAMHVKRRMLDVARVHYGDCISSRFFTLWREMLKEKHKEQQQINVYIMAKGFKKWKRWTCLSKQYNQEKYDVAEEVDNLFILRRSYNIWKETYLLKKAMRCYDMNQKIRAFKLWSLQLLKRKLQRRLARSHRIRLCQKKFFTKWKSKMEEICSRRLLFMQKLETFLLRCHWERLKKGVKEETLMRSSAARIDTLCKKNTIQHFFSSWKHQYTIECFKTRCEEQNEKYILRIHYEKWKIRRKKSLLLHKMESWHVIQGKLLTLRFFSRWQHQKHKRELKNFEYEEKLSIAQQNKLSRTFSIWRRKYHDEIIVKTFLCASQRKVLARCFKLWILVKRRAELSKLQQLNVLSEAFSYWRNAVQRRIVSRKRKIENDNNVLWKCVSHWKDYVSICMQRRETSVTCFARHWLDVTQQRVMDRRIVQAEKVSNEIIKKVHFAKWQHQYNTVFRRRLKMECLADEHHHCNVYTKSFNMWLRQQNVTIIVRNYRREKEKLLLATSFKHWLEVNRQDMQLLLNNFAEKLTVNKNSLQVIEINQRWNSPRVNNTISQSNNNSLLDLYKDSLESSLQQQQQNDTLQLEIQTSQLQNENSLKENEYDSNYSLLQKADQSEVCTSYPSLLFSPNDFSSSIYNQELLDYNTDNDIDQDQIWEEPTSRSELQLNFSSQTTISEDNFMRSNNFSFMSSNIRIPRENIKLPKWIDQWKKRYIHSKTLSKRKRYSHDDVIAPHSSSLLLSLSGTLRSQRDLQLSLSVDGENKNVERNIDQRKVALLVATLKYWKHLDISAVFYAWLEYTQRKKYLRLMQDYLVEKKKKYDMHMVFLQWNRKLYGVHAFAYFREKNVMYRYFGQWMKYHLFQQLKCTRTQRAKELHRKSLIKSYFKQWKKRCHLEFLLSGVNNSLDNDLEILINDFTDLKNKQKLESVFLSWKVSTLQMKLSKVHYENRLQLKCLNTWGQVVLEKGYEKMKLRIFQRNHQLQKVFLLWKRRMYCQICVHQVTQTKQTVVKSSILSRWHKWTKSRLDERLKGKVFLSRVNYQLVYDTFTMWKVQHKHTMCAVDHHSYIICTKVFSSWRGVTGQKVDYENKMKSFQNKCTKNLILKAFTWWKEMHESELRRQEEGDTLSITFKAWKETTLHSKANKLYVDTQFKHVFKSWKEKYVSRNEIQFLAKISCRRWKRLVEKSKSNAVILDTYLEQKNLSIKREYFLKWRKNTQVLAISKSHSEGKLLSTSFSTWKHFRECQIVTRHGVSDMKKKHVHNMVRYFFKMWKENHTRKKALAEIKQRLTMIVVKEKAVHWKLTTKQHIFSSKNEHGMLKKYFVHWNRSCQQLKKAIQLNETKIYKQTFFAWRTFKECQISQRVCITQIQKIHMKNLVTSCFKTWRENHIRKKALADIKQRLTMIMVKDKAVQWKLRTKENIFSSKNDKILLKKCFQEWGRNYQQIRKAIQFDEMNKKRRCMLHWIRSTRRQAEVNTMVDAYIKVKQKHTMKVVLFKWREYKTDSIEAQKLYEARCLIATKHYNQHLVTTFFANWNMKTKSEKLRKIRHKIIAREYFKRWRSNIAVANMVISLFQQKRCEIYWRKWRDAYIQQYVLKVMEKREQRKVMSVVFASWNKHTRLKRTLPNQMQMLQTAKWFRRWKNRCNS